MKLYWSIATAILPLAAAAPPFILQNNADAAPLAELTVDQFQQIQHKLKDTFDHAVDESKRLATDTFNLVEQAVVEIEDSEDHPHKHPLPPPFLDFSQYTVLEIVNASFSGHHDGEGKEFGRFERKLRRSAGFPHPAEDDEEDEGEHHKPDPKHLPLHRLANIINFSPEAAKVLEGDGITFLAPDDWALTPPHKRDDKHHPRFAAHHNGHLVSPLEQEDEEAPFAEVPHPFHTREFSSKRLRKLAAQSFDGDDDEEKKKELIKKVIAYIAKYHTIPHAIYPHHLADHSTVPTLIKESRVRVEPALAPFPFPHPTLRFNHYASKRGPFIKAKNGVIYLLSAPLFPPFTPLNQLFLAPQFFSGFTNAVQKVDLDEHLLPDSPSSDFEDLEMNPVLSGLVNELVEEHKLKDFTVFAPTNAVFRNAPPEIVAGLHSPFPFAKKVLKYILGYHIVPGITFFSDHFENQTAAVEQYVVKRETNVEVPSEFLFDGPARGPPHGPPRHWPKPPHVPEHPPHEKVNVTHYVLPTLISHFSPNATIKAAVFEYRIFGFGPRRRSIVIFPSHPYKKEDEEESFLNYHPGGDHDHDHEHRGLTPIRVAFPDVPAKAGAIHILGDRALIPPPPPHHDHDHDGGDKDKLSVAARLAAKEAMKFRKAVLKLFHSA